MGWRRCAASIPWVVERAGVDVVGGAAALLPGQSGPPYNGFGVRPSAGRVRPHLCPDRTRRQHPRTRHAAPLTPQAKIGSWPQTRPCRRPGAAHTPPYRRSARPIAVKLPPIVTTPAVPRGGILTASRAHSTHQSEFSTTPVRIPSSGVASVLSANKFTNCIEF